MGQFLSIITIILLWIISFVEPSGWAQLIHLPDKINITICAFASIYFIANYKKRLPISQWLLVGIILTLVIIPYAVSDTWQGASYAVAFLTVYIISQCRITEAVIKYTALAIAGLGLCILYIYVYGNILSGWNDNAISIVGLFSFLYFSIFLISRRKGKSFWYWNIVTLLYLNLLFKTDCRSGMLFSMIAVTGIYFARRTRLLLSRKNIRLILLNFPLIISLIVIGIAASSYFPALERWSWQNLDKGIFNGRNELWDYAYQQLEKSYYIGTGKFMINYHNSGVAALSVFGILGYICWIKFFSKCLSYLKTHISDQIIFGCMLAFLLIFMQQSFDLGFIAECPNLLPYTILGIGLGRARMLKH